jgi:hypothetical protein
MGNRRKQNRQQPKSTLLAAFRLCCSRLGMGGVVVVMLLLLTIAYYVFDLFVHPSLWNTFVVMGMLGLVGIIAYSNLKWSRAKNKRRKS